MAHQQLAKSLETLGSDLKAFLGANYFELLGIDHVAPFGHPQTLQVGHSGCYLAVTRGRSAYNTITFELRLDLSQWGKAELLVLRGKFTDTRYAGDRYERWYNSPHAHPYMLDIFDRVDRMAAYAIRLLEKHARETLNNTDFQLMASVPSAEVYAVVDYFRVPVQIDYLG
jgi:hypothetical protein